MLKAKGVEMLPQLSYFNISNVPELALPSLPSIELLDVGEINYHSSPVYNHLGLFPKRIVCSMHNLKLLIIVNINKLRVLPRDLHSLSVLEELHISKCYGLESFSMHALQGLISLRVLTIDECLDLISLSEGMGDLASLERLVIQNCPELVLPSNMNKLTSLRQVAILCYSGNSRILQGLEVIPSLQNLTLSYFNHLPESLGAMTSLQRVEIISCRKAKSLPNSFHNLINLHTLLIAGCPVLEKRCKKGTEEDWKKIDHVPELELIATDTYYGNILNPLLISSLSLCSTDTFLLMLIPISHTYTGPTYVVTLNHLTSIFSNYYQCLMFVLVSCQISMCHSMLHRSCFSPKFMMISDILKLLMQCVI